MLLGQVSHTGAPWSYTPSARDLGRELAALVRDERVLLLLLLAVGSGLGAVLLRRRGREVTTTVVLLSFTFVPVLIGWGLSHVEPSWATRYLAVSVGPLLLLCAFGLARAGGTGVGGLVMVVLLLVQPMTRLQDGIPHPLDGKSNAPAVAAHVRPLLQPGDLVVVAQPEAVPLAAYYFGEDLAYADPTGVVADPTVMDWRDAEDRLKAAAASHRLQGAVDDLRPGQRVVLLRPADKARRTDTEWITLVRRNAVDIATELRERPNLRRIASYKRKPRSFISLRAEVYEVG
jgi:4-amino-4-deoxy-L-arabinose transferase-like glycosyltransferase